MRRGFSSYQERFLTTSPLAASLNSNRKAPVSTSTVKKPYLRLVNRNQTLRWGKKNTDTAEELCLEGQLPGVASSLLTMRLVFCGYYLMKLQLRTCEVSISQTRHSNVLVLLLSCEPGLPAPLSILVRASSVL